MEKKGCSVWKIIAVITTVVAGICAIIAVAMKLYSKYCLLNEPMNVTDEEEDEADDSAADETSETEEA